MPSRPAIQGQTRQRMLAAAPLAVFLVVLVVASWAGREQLKQAIEASGAFVAAQFGQPKSEPLRRGVAGLTSAASTAAKVSNAEGTSVATDPAAKESKAGAATGTAEAKKASKDTEATGTAAVKVVVEIDDKGRKLKILDAPIPEGCYPHVHADYAGDAVVWGLGHKQASAADCCAACKEHQRANKERPCNIWVWCGDPSGVCWTMDIHNHTTGDCWLKHQAKWDNNPDLASSNLEINHIDKFPPDFRAVHKTSPEYVPWVAGVVPAKAQ